MNMGKSKQSAYFRRVLQITFLHFQKLFQRILNQHEILHFLITILNFWNMFFALISIFSKLWMSLRMRRLKKTENLFL